MDNGTKTPYVVEDPREITTMKQPFGDLNSTEQCPNCNSHNTEGQGVDVGERGASQACSCFDCDATWILTFKLTGYEFLELSDDE